MNALKSGPVCPACAEREPAGGICPHGAGGCCLRDLPDGARTHVRALRGGRQSRSRLYSLGFVPGTEVLVSGRGEAGCRVQVRDTCVVLDCESACNILCDAVEAPGMAGGPHHGGVLGRLLWRR